MLEKIGVNLINRLDPERAHSIALSLLHTPLAPRPGPFTSPAIATRIAGIEMPNPVGLAAGFDKNATAIAPLMQAGFGFLEVGAATPRPQPGNPKPRLFRLRADQGVINRFGFNNEGMDLIIARLAARPRGIPVGLNLGANKDSEDRAADFARVMRAAAPHVDFATVNVSSPNTERLRDLQGPDALRALLDGVMEARGTTPVFLKIAPDLTDAEIAAIARVATDAGIAAIIATNTTLERGGLKSPNAGEAGGLSGQPLFARSTRVLARLYTETGGTLPLIGVGGVASPRQAYEKILAGASAIQLYTGLVYSGLGLVTRIARGLDIRLKHEGLRSLSDAVGQGAQRWAEHDLSSSSC